MEELGLYGKWFNEARDLYKAGDYEQCLEKAEYLLTDPTLPHYVSIKTCILIAYATDDWDNAEKHRNIAESILEMARKKVTPANDDAETQEALNELRKELDMLAADQKENEPSDAGDPKDTEADEEDYEMDAGWGDEEELEDVEKAMAEAEDMAEVEAALLEEGVEIESKGPWVGRQKPGVPKNKSSGSSNRANHPGSSFDSLRLFQNKDKKSLSIRARNAQFNGAPGQIKSRAQLRKDLFEPPTKAEKEEGDE